MADRVIYEALGKAISRERARHKMTQQNLADAIGISRASIANIERGEQRVYLDQVFSLIACFGIDDVSSLLQNSEISAGSHVKKVTFSGDKLKRQQKKELRHMLEQLTGSF